MLTNIRTFEFGPNAFARYEGEVFALIGDKRQSATTTRRHPKDASVGVPPKPVAALPLVTRELKARAEIDRIISSTPDCHWTELSRVADLHRGKRSGTWWKRQALHLSSREGIFWNAQRGRAHTSKDGTASAKHGDLAIGRVGRGCQLSLGLIVLSGKAKAVTDCVIIIRPRDPLARLRILFAMRVAMRIDSFAMCVVRGTGAQFIGQQSLAQLPLPVSLATIRKDLFSEFVEAIADNDIAEIRSIEERVAGWLGSKRSMRATAPSNEPQAKMTDSPNELTLV